MKNGTVDIMVFDILDDIWNENSGGRTIEVWAEAAGYQKPRISELRRISKQSKGEPVKQGGVGRAVTIEKITKLYNALNVLIGGKIVKNAILDKLKKLDNPKDQCLLLVLTLDDKKSVDLLEILKGMMKSELYTSK